MTVSFSVNTLQVDFESVLNMENSGMVDMFKTLENTGIQGFLNATDSVYEATMVEFFANAKVIEGTIETVIEMRGRFSGSNVQFRAHSKKKEMKMELRLLYDILAKALCAKAGLSKGYVVQSSVLLENMVKADRGESVKLHPQNVLNSKSMATYVKKNLKPSRGQEPRVVETKKAVSKKKKAETTEVDKKKKKLVKKTVNKTVEAGSQDAPVKSTSETSSDDESSAQIAKETATNDRAIVVRSSPEHPAKLAMTYTGQGIFAPIQIRVINCTTHFLPKIDPAAKGIGMLEVIARPNPVQERCQLVLNTAWEDFSSTMALFDEWMNFRTVVRLRDVSSFEDLTKIEDQFLWLDETEQVDELLQRMSMLMYKMYELEVQKLVDEHLENFKLDVPSVNHDYLCIRFLNKELKEIARKHRDQRVLDCLPIVSPEASFAGDVANLAIPHLSFSDVHNGLSTRAASVQSAQPKTFAIDFSTQDEQEQEKAKESAQQGKQVDVNVEVVNRIVEKIEETWNEQLSSAGIHQTTEQLAPEMVVYTGDSKENTRLTFENDTNSSHTGSQQVFVTSPPASHHTNNKLEEVEKVIASLDSRIMSMDSRMLSMDSKVQPMDSRLESMDSKIEQFLNVQTFLKHDFGTYKRAFYDKMDTMDGNVKSSQTSMETTVLHHLTDHQLQLASDLDYVRLQLAELVNHLKEPGDANNGEGGQSGSRPGEGSGRQGEGPSSTRVHVRQLVSILVCAEMVNTLLRAGCFFNCTALVLFFPALIHSCSCTFLGSELVSQLVSFPTGFFFHYRNLPPRFLWYRMACDLLSSYASILFMITDSCLRIYSSSSSSPSSIFLISIQLDHISRSGFFFFELVCP
ncbi:hypothetical protein F511_03866 [Dorcoceras hygrometricum]|nr:hypothetical protein F511_03866 [Dorcoceras hygrometricum]